MQRPEEPRVDAVVDDPQSLLVQAKELRRDLRVFFRDADDARCLLRSLPKLFVPVTCVMPGRMAGPFTAPPRHVTSLQGELELCAMQMSDDRAVPTHPDCFIDRSKMMSMHDASASRTVVAGDTQRSLPRLAELLAV